MCRYNFLFTFFKRVVSDICPVKSSYYLSAITAYAVWGLFSLVLRPLRAFAPLDILYNRIVLCALLIVPVVFFFRSRQLKASLAFFRSQQTAARYRLIGWNVFMGLLLTANWYLFIYVMNFVSVRATSLSYLVCPILTALLAAILLKEKLDHFKWSGIGLGILGCAVLSFGHLWDLALSIMVAFSYALYLILQKKNQGLDPVVVLAFHFLIALFALFPMGGDFAFSGHDNYFYVFIGLIAVFFTIVPLWLNLFALKGLDSATVGMLINVNPIIAFSLAILYFREKASTAEIIGYSIVFLSVLVFNFRAISGRRKKLIAR